MQTEETDLSQSYYQRYINNFENTSNTDSTNFTLALEKSNKKGVHSQIENLLLLSFPGNNLNPLDLKSMAFFTS